MRKIYPPFNKFVGFLLYGLLSIAVITLAQKNELLDSLPCMPKPMTSNPARVTIGYFQLFTNPNPNPKTIPWEFYDYINVIAYPKDGKYSFLRPADPDAAKLLLAPIKNLVDNKKAKTKILLSIRNYDASSWPDNDEYGTIIKQTTDTIQDFNLDGVDFEYPGMRGSLCQKVPDGGGGPGGGLIWDKGKDPEFAKFIGDLKEAMGKIKGKPLTLMLTVGSDPIIGLDFENINFLNIETYHNSIYQNIKSLNFQPPPGTPSSISSYPNSPFNVFDAAYKNWANTGIGKERIIMGVDFGNTFQVVYNNPDIATKQQVIFTPQNNEDFRQDPVLAKIKKIDSICPNPNPELFLYFLPWNILSTSILDQNQCNGTKNADANWVHKFDEGNDGSYTPWLYRDNGDYQYISYEDYFSLNKKLDYANSNSIGGMSIRDISDDDSSNSLINFMQVIRGKGAASTSDGGKAGPATQGQGPTSSTTSTNDPGITPPGSSNLKSSPGAIVGGVFGSLVLIILGVCGFYFYRNRKLPKSSSSIRSFFKFNKGFPNSRNHAISRNPEMTSEPTLAPPTTVIPVASGYVTAMFDFTGKEENDLSFKKGDKIEVLERGDGPNDWWVGRVNGAVGEFPGNYVKET